MLRHVDDLMPIGEFAERSGLSPKRLRSYATGGLLVPAAVDSASGYRYYSPGQLREAKLIDALRQADMPLSDIASFLGDRSPERLDAWARRVETDAEQRQKALAAARILLWTEPYGDKREESKVRLTTAGQVNIGRVRETNEDAFLAGDRIVAVADGVGGRPGGEVASAMAISVVEAAFTGRSLDELEAAVRAANRVIWDRATTDAALEGIGTTICAAGLTEDCTIVVANVGDSRAYLVRGRSLTLLTVDHTVTAELVGRGELSEVEANDDPRRSVLTRVLGGGPDVEPHRRMQPVQEGDRLLLCTDGLTNEVALSDVGSIMSAGDDVVGTADHLVERALARGGRDNIAVVVAEVCT